MCLAIPAKVVSIDEGDDTATVCVGGIKKTVSLALVEDVNIDDYLLLHVGYALSKIDPQEARKTLQLFAAAGMLSE